MLDRAAYPYKLSRPIPLDPISHGNDGLFYYRTSLASEHVYNKNHLQNRFINGDLSQYAVHFAPDPLTPEGIRLTVGGVGLSTGYHTHSKA